MNFIDKLLHAIAFGLIGTIINWALQKFNLYNQAGKGKRFVIFSIVAFIVFFIVNIIWPYPS